MTKPSYRPTSKWINKLAASTKAKHSTFYHEDTKCLTASETREIVDKLISGPEAFMIWMTLVGHERAKELASKSFSRILQALPNLAPKETSVEDWLDIQGQIFLTIGDLCLKHNILTISAARACLNVALSDIAGHQRSICDAEIRYNMALGIMISKLACRLKFAKAYQPLNEKAESEFSKKLKKLEI